MTTRYLLDTHGLLWFMQGSQKLGPRAKAILSDPASDLIVPAIVIAEGCWIIEHQKIGIRSARDFLAALDADSRISVVPLDRAVIKATLSLSTINEMHDRQIIATAIVVAATGFPIAVVTKDTNIRDAGLIPVVW